MKRSKITNTAEEVQTGNGALLLISQMLGDTNGSTILRQESKGQQELVNSRELPKKYNGHMEHPNGERYTTEEIYASMGIKLLPTGRHDDMFYETVLPSGWKVKPTSHSMWSNLVDDKGRTRASIFYKAAFYDRDAFFNLERRFSIDFHNSLSEEERYLPVEVKTRQVEVPKEARHGDQYGYMIYNDRKQFKTETYEVRPRRYEDTYEERNNTPHYVEVKDCDDNILFKTEPKFFKRKYKKENHAKWWADYEQFRELQKSLGTAWLTLHYPNWKSPFAYWSE